MTCDQIYLMGDTSLVQIGFSLGSFCTFLQLLTLRYQDMTHSLHGIKYVYQFEQGLLKYPLNNSSQQKMKEFRRIVAKLILDICIPFTMIFGFFWLTYFTYHAYIDPKSNYSLILTVFWYILLGISGEQFVGLISLSFLNMVSVSYALIIKFNEITDYIKICIAQNKRDFIRYNLIDLIEEHNYFTKITADINKSFRIGIISVYFLTVPMISLLVYSTHHKNTEYITKVLGGLCAIAGTGLAFQLLSVFPIVIKAAHSPYPLIFSRFCKSVDVTDIGTRLKLISFMERLSGPDIGFYCYDLFPMNSWQLFHLLIISAMNYILLMQFL